MWYAETAKMIKTVPDGVRLAVAGRMVLRGVDSAKVLGEGGERLAGLRPHALTASCATKWSHTNTKVAAPRPVPWSPELPVRSAPAPGPIHGRSGMANPPWGLQLFGNQQQKRNANNCLSHACSASSQSRAPP